MPRSANRIALPAGLEPGPKVRRRQQFAIDRSAHRGDAADFIDRRPHHREVEPVLAADVAVKHFADMQADIGRSGRPAIAGAAGVERGHVASETMLGPKGGSPGGGHVGVGELRQHAVADQLQDVAALVMDGVDRGLRIIVEERNDLVGPNAFADRGRTAQVGKPQHRADALGDAARDPSAQHLLGSILPEIDPAQRAGDVDLSGGFDGEPQRRHQIAQRRLPLLVKAVGAPRHPVGIEAVHLAERAGFAEAVHERDKMPMPLGGELVDQRKIKRGAIGELHLELLDAAFEHVIENGAAPVLGGFAFAGRAVFEHVAFVGLGIVPAKSTALENRMQGIDENAGARQIEAARAAALAEAADQIVLRQPGQALADQPIHQLQTRREIHRCIMPRNHP
jgi:hypothetical protein